MTKHYCHSCALTKGLINNLSPHLNFTGSSYQVDKYIKHTVEPTGSGQISIFDDPGYDNYKNHIINTAASGSVEQLDNGKINYVYYAGHTTGFHYSNGNFITPIDAVKIVLPNDFTRIHAYPTGSLGLSTAHCNECGNPVLS